MRSAALLVFALVGCTRNEAPVAAAEHPAEPGAGAWVMYEGDAGCHYIPPDEWARQNAVIEERYAASAREYQEACREGDRSSCSLLAGQVAEGRGVARSAERAATLYRRTIALESPLCERGDPHACDGLSAAYLFGWGVPIDEPRARIYGAHAYRLFAAACDDGDGDACRYQAHKLFVGDDIAKDRVLAERIYERAVTLLDRACNVANNPESCRSIFAMFALGDGVPKDEARGEAALDRARTLWIERCARGDRVACKTAEKVKR